MRSNALSQGLVRFPSPTDLVVMKLLVGYSINHNTVIYISPRMAYTTLMLCINFDIDANTQR